MKHAPDLLPCPHCGGTEIEIRHATTGYAPKVYYPSNPAYVECVQCGCRTAKRIYAKDAVNAWNRRVNNEFEGRI